LLVYNLSISVLSIIYRLAALFNTKAYAFVSGRTNIFSTLKSAFEKSTPSPVWIHCASLGEFEQGRPIIEALKKSDPQLKILLTFFSPSGYEVRKNYALADYVFYLPWDTATNAKRFLDITKPRMAIFIKYEFWYHYSKELKNRNIPLVSACSIFRPEQIFFKWYGQFYRKILKNFTYFFVQNETSIALLRNIEIENCSLVGDTRFDRVYDITRQAEEIEKAKNFKANEKTFVIGSLWPEDLEVLAPFINSHAPAIKFIIAPHEISEKFLSQIEQSLNTKTIRYSQQIENIDNYSVLLIDNIGMLSRLYRYGEFAYVGGAFGKGLHNILEAACYGVPVFFGNKNYKKFQEANELIMRGGAYAVADYEELKTQFELLIKLPASFLLACEVTRTYVQENLGATSKIVTYCREVLKS
jgi:3-deoxy-D-manno-octulosonic-acid transferase